MCSISLYCEEHGLTAQECVHQMRDAVFHATKLTVSAGIAPNKVSIYTVNTILTISINFFRCLQRYVFPDVLALLSKPLICCRYVPIRSVFAKSNFKFLIQKQNKPNGQFQLDFDSKVIKEFMRDLSIRKVPGIGRVNERLLEAIGIKASQQSKLCHPEYTL